MSVVCRDVFRLIEELAPLNLAEGWDNPGLQAGDPGKVITKALLALDVSGEVVDEAVEKKTGLIITHHPLLFSPVKSLDLSRPTGLLLERIIKSGLTVYSAHTNLDVARRGVNDVLAGRLGLEDRVVLAPIGNEKYFKLVVFVPDSHVSEVHQALSDAGAGWIGNYSHCAFSVRGEGVFLPRSGSRPYIGKEGELSRVGETRLETIVPAGVLGDALQAMLSAHPYEEAAYDAYPLENRGPAYGLGLTGNLPTSLGFEGLIELVKSALNLPWVRAGGDKNKVIRKVAVCGGSGAKLWPQAVAAGAEAFITGDVGYHDAQDMLTAGLSFIDPGHYGSEMPVIPMLRDYLAERLRNVEFIVSNHKGDPFIMV